MRRCLLVLAGVIVALTIPAAAPAFPGANGLLAYSCGPWDNPGICVMDVPSGIERRLPLEGAAGDPECSFVQEPRWSADGRRIAFVRGVRLEDGTCGREIAHSDAEGRDVRRVTAAQRASGLTWSPKGDELAFGCGLSAEGGTHICIVRSDGTELRNITPDDSTAHSPDWSPDGTRIAFSSWRERRTWTPSDIAYSDREAHRIYVMRPDGDDVQPFAAFGHADTFGYPAWSPDGRGLAFSATYSTDCRPFDCNRRDAIGRCAYPFSDPLPVAAMWGGDSAGGPRWSPDGTTLAFHVYGDRSHVWLMPQDGSSARPLVEGSSPDWQPLPRAELPQRHAFPCPAPAPTPAPAALSTPAPAPAALETEVTRRCARSACRMTVTARATTTRPCDGAFQLRVVRLGHVLTTREAKARPGCTFRTTVRLARGRSARDFELRSRYFTIDEATPWTSRRLTLPRRRARS